MDTASLQPLIHRFLDALSNDPSIQEHHEEHQRRVETAQQLLQSDRIPDLPREELKDFLRNTDAWYGTRGRIRFWRELLGEDDERLPALKETVAEVERRLSVVAALEASVKAALARTGRLRQAVLKQAFEGRLVPQDPNDEPASVLLERIRAKRGVGKKDGRANRKRKRSQQPRLPLD